MILLNPHLKIDKADNLNPYTVFKAHTVQKTGEHVWKPLYFFKTLKEAYLGIMRLCKKDVTDEALAQIEKLLIGEEDGNIK